MRLEFFEKFMFLSSDLCYLYAEVAAGRVFAVLAVEAGRAVTLTEASRGVDVASSTVQTLAIGADLAKFAGVAIWTGAEGGHLVHVRFGHRVAEAAVEALAVAQVHRNLTTSAGE